MIELVYRIAQDFTSVPNYVASEWRWADGLPETDAQYVFIFPFVSVGRQ